MKKPGTILNRSLTKAASLTPPMPPSEKSERATEGKEIYRENHLLCYRLRPRLDSRFLRWLPANMSLLFRWLGF